MKVYKKIGVGLLMLLGLLFTLAIWYKYAFSMEEATPMEINSPSLEQKVLIATQGSEFKNKVTLLVTDYYKKKSVFIKVIDIKMLDYTDPASYNAIVILHTWEYSKPPQSVENFVERTKEFNEKIVFATTSGSGDYGIQGVDAISGESILKNAEEFSEKIILRVNTILSKH
jgi:hypothetical protein